MALICKDLGVKADLSLWEDEAWAMVQTGAITDSLSLIALLHESIRRRRA